MSKIFFNVTMRQYDNVTMNLLMFWLRTTGPKPHHFYIITPDYQPH